MLIFTHPNLPTPVQANTWAEAKANPTIVAAFAADWHARERGVPFPFRGEIEAVFPPEQVYDESPDGFLVWLPEIRCKMAKSNFARECATGEENAWLRYRHA